MIFAVWSLEAGEFAVGAERFLMKPVAIAVKLTFGEIRVVCYLIFWM